MAEGEQAEGAAEGGEVASAPKGKLKLIIMVVGLFAVLGGGAATYFLFFRHGA
jgi:flagellar FliL protein